VDARRKQGRISRGAYQGPAAVGSARKFDVLSHALREKLVDRFYSPALATVGHHLLKRPSLSREEPYILVILGFHPRQAQRNTVKWGKHLD
jgi:hypothetical protein